MMRHITNGDHAAQRIQEAGIPGTVLPWRDVLHEGPVPAGLTFDELRVARARYIAAVFSRPFDAVLQDFADRDRTLEESLADEEVVLWFEHDLYDQLQLIQVLDWFAGRPLGDTRLSLICAAEYLGTSTPARLRDRFPSRHPVSPAQLELARKAWAAFRSADPASVVDLLHEDTSPLPFLGDALLRHMQQYPSVANGLSRSEVQALEAIASGVTKLSRVYMASHHDREEAVFLGDATFALYMVGLSRGKEPLVVQSDEEVLVAPRGPADAARFWDSDVRLTGFGRDVLDGRADCVKVNGIDRWLGGVHLTGPVPRWRWDPATRRVSAAPRAG